MSSTVMETQVIYLPLCNAKCMEIFFPYPYMQLEKRLQCLRASVFQKLVKFVLGKAREFL